MKCSHIRGTLSRKPRSAYGTCSCLINEFTSYKTNHRVADLEDSEDELSIVQPESSHTPTSSSIFKGTMGTSTKKHSRHTTGLDGSYSSSDGDPLEDEGKWKLLFQFTPFRRILALVKSTIANPFFPQTRTLPQRRRKRSEHPPHQHQHQASSEFRSKLPPCQSERLEL